MVSTEWMNVFKSNSENDEIYAVLQSNLLFQDLTKREVKFVNDIIHIREYRPEEKIFSQGEIGVGMYIIVSGSVNIYIEDQSLRSNAEKEVYITRLGAGDFFGELSLVEDDGRRSATACCHEDTKVIGFFKPDLVEILERNPNVGVKVVYRLAEILGQRLVKTTDKVSLLRKEIQNLTTSTKEERTYESPESKFTP